MHYKTRDGLIIDNQTIRKISIFFVILQSIGIRFFGGFGFCLLLLIIILNRRNIVRITQINKPQTLLILMLAIFVVCIIKGFSFLSITYVFLAIMSGIMVLLNYCKNYQSFISDLKPALIFFSIYGFISWFLLLIVPGLFHSVNLGGMNYSTLGYLLYNNRPSSEFPRLSSLLWEPGCCQFILNLLLLILVTERKALYKLVFITILILATRSTTGYINLIAIIIYYFIINRAKLLKTKYLIIFCIALGCISSLGLYSMMTKNISDKFLNSSGIIRTRDFYVGLNLAMAHPIIGVDTENLKTDPEAQILEDEVWGGTNVWTSTQGYFAGGYTNGFMGVFLDYGLILGLILYGFTLKAPIIWNNREFINPYIFYLIYFCSLTGEPISRTSMFFLFSLSFLVNKTAKKKTIEKQFII